MSVRVWQVNDARTSSVKERASVCLCHLPLFEGQGVYVGGRPWGTVEPPLHQSALRPLAEVPDKEDVK